MRSCNFSKKSSRDGLCSLTLLLFLASLTGHMASSFSLTSPSVISSLSLSLKQTTLVLFAQSAGDSSSDPVVQLPLLEAKLADSSSSEKDDLQFQIDQAKMAGEFGVRKVQLEFYEAFASQDIEKMKQVWSTTDSCKCVHPGMTCITGAEEILNSWEVLFTSEAFEIEPKETSVDICGSTAICHCVETIGTSSKLEAVNIYKREGGEWKMTMHIASPVMGF